MTGFMDSYNMISIVTYRTQSKAVSANIDLKALVKISTSYKQLSFLLVLLLAFGNMAFSAHVSSHAVSDSGFCSLCIHPGGPDTAITQEPNALFSGSAAFRLTPDYVPIRLLPAILHIHQSRAPPGLA